MSSQAVAFTGLLHFNDNVMTAVLLSVESVCYATNEREGW
jgi:hypothetical protein